MNLFDYSINMVLSNMRRSGLYPNRFTLLLFYLFAGNTVFPLFDVPLLGLSVTAIFFVLIALELLFRLGYLSIRQHAPWFLSVLGIGLGTILSTFANGLSGSLPIDTGHFVVLIQAGYWLVVCLVTMALVGNLNQADFRTMIYVLGVSIIVVSAVRVYEAVVFDRIGSGTARIFSQNVYGILFSTFSPFALIMVFSIHRTYNRYVIAVGVLVLFLAIALNGSRSSWITAGVGMTILSLLLLIVQRRKITSLGGFSTGLIFFCFVTISVLPSNVVESISIRFATLQRIDEDKSFATRVLMQQKALALLQENPLFGVGRGQFRETYVELDLANTPFGEATPINFNRIASHNSYAQYVAEQGLVGILPFTALLILIVIKGFPAAVRLGRSGNLGALAILSGFIAMSIHLWSIDNLQTTSSWFMYGLAAGMIEYERQVNKTTILEKV